MTDPIEAAKLASLAWMDSDEAMALVHLSNDSEFDDAISAGQARAAIAAYLAAQWRDMDSAPKDGKPFLAGWWSDTYWQCEKVHWANGPVYEGDNGIDGLIEVPATHWQPLPEPPKEQG